MTFIWLFFWAINGFPSFALDTPGSWSISLVVCMFLDVLHAFKRSTRP